MASMETLDGVVSLDNLVVVSQELEPYVLSLQTGPEEDGEMEVVVLAVMKRQAGVLVALPTDVLLEETLDRGNSGDQDLLFGPSTVVEVPSVFQNNGVITSTGGRVSVVIVDCLPDILSSMRELIPGEPIIFGFDEQMPMALPSPDALLTEAVKWISAATSDRVAYYTPEEEEAEEAKISAASCQKDRLEARSKSRFWYSKRKDKAKEGNHIFSGCRSGELEECNSQFGGPGGCSSFPTWTRRSSSAWWGTFKTIECKSLSTPGFCSSECYCKRTCCTTEDSDSWIPWYVGFTFPHTWEAWGRFRNWSKRSRML